MIVCRSAAEIEKLARVNALVARVLKELAAAVRPGITTADLDAIAEQRLREAGAELTVYKNSLTEIAMRELALPSMTEYLAGPTAFVFGGEDPVVREPVAPAPTGGLLPSVRWRPC